MPICHYFQQGNCRYGDRCRFDHPRDQSGFSNQGNYRGGGGSQSQYRWSSSSYGSQTDYRSHGSGDFFSGRGGGGDGNWGNRGSQGQGGYRGTGGGGGSWGGGAGGGGGGSWGGGGSSHNGGFRGGGGGGGGKQVNFKDSFGSFQKNKFGALTDQAPKDSRGSQHHGSSQDVSAQEIMDGIHYDMEEWENGKMWPFTCYGPNKSKSCLSGLEDLSPEELRFLAYTAEKAKQFDQYRAAYNTALDAAKNKRDQLKRPSQAMRNQLVDLYKGASDRNPFAAASVSNLFGNSVPSLTDIFGANLANIKVAPGANSSTGTVVGNQSTVAPGSSMQGTLSAPSGSTASSAVPSGSSPFNRTQGTFQGVFSSTGGKSDTASATFGSVSTGGASASSVFGSGFGSGSQGSSGSSTGLFGKGSTVPVADPPPAKAESRTYTPLASLTPEEKEQFEAPIFTLGKVPTRPPPIELVR